MNNLKIVILIASILLISFLISLIIINKPETIETESSQISLEDAKSNGCEILLRNNCGISTNSILINDFDADKDGIVNNTGTGTGNCGTTQGDNLFMLCKCHYDINYYENDEENCKVFCGCLHTVSVPPPITNENQVPPPPYVIK